MTGIFDSSPIIGLAKGDCWEYVGSLFDSVLIPPEVEREVAGGDSDLPGSRELRQAIGRFVTVASPALDAMVAVPPSLAAGERAVLALAIGRDATFVVIDERAARNAASRLGLRVLSSVDLVCAMKRTGLLAEVRPTLDRMQARGYGIRADLYHAALHESGE